MFDRAGFTLVELLVSIGILLILAGLSLAVFNIGTKGDRIRAAAREIQSQLEGARDRAIFSSSRAGEPRNIGVRFLQDTTNPTIATSMVYIEATEPEVGLLSFANYEVQYTTATDPNGPGNPPDPPALLPFQRRLVALNLPAPGLLWNDLYLRRLLLPGSRIQIPADTGLWYDIDVLSFPVGAANGNQNTNTTVNGGNHQLILASDFVPTITSNTEVFSFRLELAPAIMANQEPVALPEGSAIQLAASQVPRDWQVRFWSPDTNYLIGDWVVSNPFNGIFYQATKQGTSGNSEPSPWPTTYGQTINDGNVGAGTHVVWRASESVQMDVMFTPRGTVTGASATSGLIHLVLRDTTDILAGVGFVPSDLDGDSTISEEEQVTGESLIVTIFTRTGHIASSPVDVNDTDADGNADDPFRFAETGETAQ